MVPAFRLVVAGREWVRRTDNVLDVVKCVVRIELDVEVDAAYLYLTDSEAAGAAVEQVVVDRAGRGDVVLDFDADGRLLGVEIIGASQLLHPSSLSAAERL